MVDTILTIRSNTEVHNLKISILQADTILDSTKGFFDTSSGPVDNQPEVKYNGMFSYLIPLLKLNQYVKMTFSSMPNERCADIITGKLKYTYEGGGNVKELKTKPCEIESKNGISTFWIAIIGLLVIGMVGGSFYYIDYLKKERIKKEILLGKR